MFIDAIQAHRNHSTLTLWNSDETGEDSGAFDTELNAF